MTKYRCGFILFRGELTSEDRVTSSAPWNAEFGLRNVELNEKHQGAWRIGGPNCWIYPIKTGNSLALRLVTQ